VQPASTSTGIDIRRDYALNVSRRGGSRTPRANRCDWFGWLRGRATAIVCNYGDRSHDTDTARILRIVSLARRNGLELNRYSTIILLLRLRAISFRNPVVYGERLSPKVQTEFLEENAAATSTTNNAALAELSIEAGSSSHATALQVTMEMMTSGSPPEEFVNPFNGELLSPIRQFDTLSEAEAWAVAHARQRSRLARGHPRVRQGPSPDRADDTLQLHTPPR